MSLINHIPQLETEGHWDSALIGSRIRFPRYPERWTQSELEALYEANGLNTDTPNDRVKKARQYWDKMLNARNEQIERDVTFNSRVVRAECALEQPLKILAAGVHYTHADAFLASDTILMLLAEIEQDTSQQSPTLDRYTNKDKPRTIANNISELIDAKMVGLQCRMFGIRLVSLANNQYEVALPSFSVHCVMNDPNYKRLIQLFEAAGSIAHSVLHERIVLIAPEKEQFAGGRCDIAISLSEKTFFTGLSLEKGVQIKCADSIANAEHRRDALTLGTEKLGSLLVLSIQGDDLLLTDSLHNTLTADYEATGLLKRFIKEHYVKENYGSLPSYEAVIASEPQAKHLIKEDKNPDGSVKYRVFYNDITSNRLVVETNDWLFALKVYRGHCMINGNMRLGMAVN